MTFSYPDTVAALLVRSLTRDSLRLNWDQMMKYIGDDMAPPQDPEELHKFYGMIREHVEPVLKRWREEGLEDGVVPDDWKP